MPALFRHSIDVRTVGECECRTHPSQVQVLFMWSTESALEDEKGYEKVGDYGDFGAVDLTSAM